VEVEIRSGNRALFESRPGYWEMLLAVDRLEQPLEEIAASASLLEAVPPAGTAAFAGSSEFLAVKVRGITTAFDGLRSALEDDLIASFGEPGTPGNPVAIQSACSLILTHCRDLADAGRAILRTPLHPAFAGAQRRCAGLCAGSIGEVQRLVAELRKAAEEERASTLKLRLSFATDRLAEVALALAESGSAPIAAPATESGLGCLGCLGCLGFAVLALLLCAAAAVAPWWVIAIFIGLCLLAASK
jgi:hypothetical protein